MFHSCRGTPKWRRTAAAKLSPNSSQIALRTSFFPSRDTSTFNLHRIGALSQPPAQLPTLKSIHQSHFHHLTLSFAPDSDTPPGQPANHPRHHALPRAHDLVRAHRNLPSQYNWRFYNRCPGISIPQLKLRAGAFLPRTPPARRKEDHQLTRITSTVQLWQLYLKLPTTTSRNAREQQRMKREVVQLKREMNSTSSQDEFAKWAKLRRRHDKSLEECEAMSTYPLGLTTYDA